MTINRRTLLAGTAGLAASAAFIGPFGMRGARVGSPEGLRPELQRALGDNAPSLIEVQIEPGSEGNPWPFILRTMPG